MLSERPRIVLPQFRTQAAMFTVFVSAPVPGTGRYDPPQPTRAAFPLRIEARNYLDLLVFNRKPAAGYVPIGDYWWVRDKETTRRYTIDFQKAG